MRAMTFPFLSLILLATTACGPVPPTGGGPSTGPSASTDGTETAPTPAQICTRMVALYNGLKFQRDGVLDELLYAEPPLTGDQIQARLETIRSAVALAKERLDAIPIGTHVAFEEMRVLAHRLFDSCAAFFGDELVLEFLASRNGIQSILDVQRLQDLTLVQRELMQQLRALQFRLAEHFGFINQLEGQ